MNLHLNRRTRIKSGEMAAAKLSGPPLISSQSSLKRARCAGTFRKKTNIWKTPPRSCYSGRSRLEWSEMPPRNNSGYMLYIFHRTGPLPGYKEIDCIDNAPFMASPTLVIYIISFIPARSLRNCIPPPELTAFFRPSNCPLIIPLRQ